MKGGKFPPELLLKIKDAVNIIDVVGEHVVLRKSGSNHSGLCPFHNERSPSFSVSEAKGLYHCYGCKKGGDLFSFVMEIFGISFPEAIQELADRARVALPKELSSDGTDDPEVAKRRAAAREKLQTAQKLNRFVAAFYHGELANTPSVQQYFRERGVTSELVRSFYLGAAPAGWDGLANHLIAKKAPIDLAKELGLIRPSPKRQDGYFDLFRNRAIFPILDLRGKVVGFGGRALGEPLGEKDDGPKYMNSPESFLFHKGKLAFGLFQAQKHIREKDEVVLVEGYFDVLGMHAAGFENVVATCGTSLTADHLKVFERFAKKVTILFDGDRAGITATERAMEIGLENGMVLYGASMPEGLDPDEVLLQADGKQKMIEILASAQPLLDARIDAEIDAAALGPEARAQSLKKIVGWLKRFKDPVGRDIRLEALQSRMNLSRELLFKALGERPPMASTRPTASPRPSRPILRGARTTSQGQAKLAPSEKLLLSALARGGGYLEAFEKAGPDLPPGHLIEELFEYPAARLAAGELLKGGVNLPALQDEGSDSQVRSTITEAQVAPEAPFTDTQFRVALDRALAKTWARFSQRIKVAMADAEAKKDAELQARLMMEYLDVQRKMMVFTSLYDEA
jgi:DNA primase